MYRRPLTLQPRPQKINRIDRARTKCSTESPNARCGEVIERDVFCVAGFQARFPGDDEVFEVFEGGEVDGAVGEHADEAHGEAAVEGADACSGPHFAGGGEDEGVAVEAAFDGFVLDAAGGPGQYGAWW